MRDDRPHLGWNTVLAAKSYKTSFLNVVVPAEYDPLLGWRHNQAPAGARHTGCGASFTAGSAVVEHETFPAQLEQFLDYPVINGGVGGYGTDQMILMAETLMPRLSPAAIVVGILDATTSTGPA